MLHAVPELLDALETRLIAGEDPAALLSGIRWSELVGWPEDAEGAQALRRRIASVHTLLMGLSGFQGYGRNGLAADLPGLAPRLRGKV